MKKAEDYFDSVIPLDYEPISRNEFKDDICMLIKQAQEDAIRETSKLLVTEAKRLHEVEDGAFYPDFLLTRITDKLIKEL